MTTWFCTPNNLILETESTKGKLARTTSLKIADTKPELSAKLPIVCKHEDHRVVLFALLAVN